MKLDTNCCKDCERRHIGCHATCDDYIAAKRRHDEIAAERQKEKLVNDYQAEVTRQKRKRYFGHG